MLIDDDDGVEGIFQQAEKKYFGKSGRRCCGQSICHGTVAESQVTAIVASAGGLLHAGYLACFFFARALITEAQRRPYIISWARLLRAGLTTSSKPSARPSKPCVGALPVKMRAMVSVTRTVSPRSAWRRLA